MTALWITLVVLVLIAGIGFVLTVRTRRESMRREREEER